jgi:WD40 repeat protein
LFPIFSPDGENITYCGGDGDTLDLWQKARSGGKARQLAAGLGRALPLGIANDGRLFFGLRNGASDIYEFSIPKLGPAKRATLRFPGLNRSPAWSVDGKQLAFLSRRGAENFGQESRTIMIRDWGTDRERELNPKLAYLDGISWSARGLVVSGSDGKGRGGVFLVDADSGMTRPLFATHGGPFRGYPAVLSSAGVLYFLRDGQLFRHTTVESGETLAVDLKGKLLALALAPDSKKLAVGSAEQGIRILSLPDCRVMAELGIPGSMELSWGGSLLASREGKLFEVPLDATKARELAMPGNRENGFAISPSGKVLAVTVGEQRQEIWTVQVNRP